MPRREYTPVNNRSYETASLRSFANNGCTTAGSSSITQTSSLLKEVEVRTAVGWDTPGWRKIRNEGGLLPFSGWEKFHLRGSADAGRREWCPSSSGKRSRWENYYPCGSFVDKTAGELMALVDLPDLTYLVQQAAAGIYSSGFDALTFLAEVKQLRRMFSGIVKKLEKLFQGKSPGQIHNLYLEGRYGWRTLMFDIRDFQEYLTSVNEGRSRFRQARGLTISGSWTDYSSSTSSGITMGLSSDVSWSGNCRGTVVADIDVPELQLNPLTTAWEVTRLSFVVDWLINVGQALEAASFLLRATNHTAGVGYKIDFDLDQSWALLGTTGTTICHGCNGHSSGNASVVRRSPSSVGVVPHLKLRLDGWKVLDLLSLLLQRIVH